MLLVRHTSAVVILFLLMLSFGRGTIAVAQTDTASQLDTLTEDIERLSPDHGHGTPCRQSHLGEACAPLTLIEFSNYQCPFCRRYFQTTLPSLKTEYIEPGKVRYVFRDFPFDRIHPQARKAADAAHCAGDQGKYWEMHDLLFQNQQALDLDHLFSSGS